MVSVYRRAPSKRTSTPSKPADMNWLAAWRGADGRRITRSTGTPIRKEALRIAQRWEADALLEREGVVDGTQARLAKHRLTPLAGHVEAYLADCTAAGQKPFTVSEKRRHLDWVLAKTAWARLGDINAEHLQRVLGDLHKGGKSARTCNYRREVSVALCSWLEKHGRIASNPLKLVRRLDVHSDSRRRRRALTNEELDRLFVVSPKRRLWYMLAALAGLRRAEVASLTWGDIDIERQTILISKGKSKRADLLKITPELAEALAQARPGLALPTARVYPETMTNQTRVRDFVKAGILKKDPKTNKVLLTDEDGRSADLHSLRTTLGTRLARAGIQPQVAMRLMRHASYHTTLKHYTALTLDDDAAALARLEALRTDASAATRAAEGADAAKGREKQGA